MINSPFAQVHQTLPPNRLAQSALRRNIRKNRIPENSQDQNSLSILDDLSERDTQRRKQCYSHHSRLNFRTARYKIKPEKLRSNIIDREEMCQPETIRMMKIEMMAKKEDPQFQITGRSIVGLSLSRMLPQKIDPFEEKDQTNQSLPVHWISMTANPYKPRRKTQRFMTNEQKILTKLMDKEELMATEREWNLIEKKRRERREKQKIPDWAKTEAVSGVDENHGSKKKVKTISKSMALNDF